MGNTDLNVDLLDSASERTARKKTAIIAVFFAVCVGILATIGAAASYRASSRGTSVLAEVGYLPVISEIRRFAWGNETQATTGKTTPDGRINVLLLGIGGQGHDGPELTDTIILASFDTKTNALAMLSIPRDLAFPMGYNQFRKINSLNAYEEKAHPGEGARRTADQISELLNVRIDHVLRVDFDGFSEFIDSLGGIDVTVERTFTDNTYPAENDKWRTVSFQKGPAHMNGTTALEYVRSRHGNNGEGSDFARSKRQQIVIQAVREKILSLGTLANPKKISDLINVISGHIQTDLSAWDMVGFMPEAAKLDQNKISTRVLTDAADGELSAANVNGEYMLFPRKPDWSEIRAIASNPFVTKEEELKLLQPQTNVTVEVKNGTTYEGYAFQVTQKLKQRGYHVSSFGNALHRGYDRTALYDLTGGTKNEELVRLKKMLDADVSAVTPRPIPNSKERLIYTEDMAEEHVMSTTTEFLIILGQSSLGLISPYDNQPTTP